MDRTRNIFAWLGQREEKEILNRLQLHVRESCKCVLEMKNSIEELIKGSTDAKNQHIEMAKKAEHRGDELRREIMEELAKGMLFPPDREDLLMLNESLNDIADGAKGVVRLLEFFEKDPSPEIDRILLENSMLGVKASEKLEKAIHFLIKNDIQAIFEECAGIETIEKEGDDKRRDLVKALIKTDLSPQKTILFYEIIDNLEDVLDFIKKSGDLVRMLAIKAR